MNIRRGITDATPVCVFPWEKPILEEIHGGNAEPVTIDEMCSMKGFVKATKIKLRHSKDYPPSLREQLLLMAEVQDEDEDPMQDLDAEFGRLANKYGMHPHLPIPMVEKVYGSPNHFKIAVQSMIEDMRPEPAPERSLTRQELLRQLKEMGVKTDIHMTRDDLQRLMDSEQEQQAA